LNLWLCWAYRGTILVSSLSFYGDHTSEFVLSYWALARTITVSSSYLIELLQEPYPWVRSILLSFCWNYTCKFDLSYWAPKRTIYPRIHPILSSCCRNHTRDFVLSYWVPAGTITMSLTYLLRSRRSYSLEFDLSYSVLAGTILVSSTYLIELKLESYQWVNINLFPIFLQLKSIILEGLLIIFLKLYYCKKKRN